MKSRSIDLIKLKVELYKDVIYNFLEESKNLSKEKALEKIDEFEVNITLMLNPDAFEYDSYNNRDKEYYIINVAHLLLKLKELKEYYNSMECDKPNKIKFKRSTIEELCESIEETNKRGKL